MHRRTLTPASVIALAACSLLVAACGSNSPNTFRSGLQPTQAQLKQGHQQAVRFVRCLRSHGVTEHVPDPKFTPASAFNAALAGAAQSPAFRSAYSACARLLPSQQTSQRAAPNHAQIAALLAFARCLHTHGFPRFPDPTSSGQITHQMLANAGINPNQPAMLQIADTCVSVTHGLVTKADVARFIAGR
jgi:hypothetical protein